MAEASPALCYPRPMDPRDADGRDTCAPLLSLAVHELRTPAGVVHGYLHMLQQIAAATLDERQRRMVDEAERSCGRLIAIVGEIGELARWRRARRPSPASRSTSSTSSNRPRA